VLIAPYRHPLILAEEIGMVDQLIEGRLEIGFARGASPHEYVRFGIDDKEAAGRMQECMDILLGVWGTDGDFSFDGKYFKFPATYVNPRPLQARPPMSLAARSPESLRYCLQNGLAIHTTPLRQPKSAAQTAIDTIAAIVDEFPGMEWPEVAIETETFVSNSEAVVMNAMRHVEQAHIRTNNFGKNGREAVRGFGSLDPLPPGIGISAEQLAERCVTGDGAAVLRQVQDYRDMGMTEFIAYMDFGQSQREILDAIALFGSKVISADWTTGAVRGPKARNTVSPEKRDALRKSYDARFGANWHEWREADWIKWFDAKSGDERFEIFDIAVNPDIRADANGIVPTTGKLCLLRNLACPKCGRPSLVLSYRPNSESPKALGEIVARSQAFAEWHSSHP
jgi:alkanesulfonate monooxygenase SsuD/methylene tetrahydromethanopterin reductase-like flavin-dependent oxidoreductase (luciferase family)